MLLDMVTEIVMAHPDMMVSGKMQESVDISPAVKKAKADIVILREPAGRQDHQELLYSRPHLKVLSITSDGHRFFLHELRPFRAALGEVSPENLMQAIRSSAQRRLG
jgi:DNA-binding NarL/FixJ family response regulator